MISYSDFSNLARSKATAGNVHAINGVLGRLLNTFGNYQYWSKSDNAEGMAEADKALKSARGYLKTICLTTGLCYSLDSIDFDN